MPRNAVLTFLYAAVTLQAGAYGLTFLLPNLFIEFGADEKIVGQMLGIATVATIVTAYFAGHLVDIFGRLYTLAIACIALSFSMLLYGFATQTGFILIVASVLLGFGWALTYSLAPVALMRLIGPDERVRAFAMLSIFVMSGFGLAPVFASWMLNAGFQVADAFIANSVICAIASTLFALLKTPMRSHAKDQKAEPRSSLTLSSIKEIWRTPAWLPCTMVMIGASVFAGMNNFQTSFAEERGLDFAPYFLTYTVTVVILRALLAKFKGGSAPYLMIGGLQIIMALSVVIFRVMPS